MAIVEACGFQGTPSSPFSVLQKCHSDFLSLNGTDTERAELAAAGIKGKHLTYRRPYKQDTSKRIKRQSKRFLEWREKQRPKPLRVRYWQSRKPIK